MKTEKEEYKALEVKLKKQEKKLKEARENLKPFKDKAAKFDQIPFFAMEKNSNHGRNPDGEWPDEIWLFCVECLSTRLSINLFQSLLHSFKNFFLTFLDKKKFQIPSDTTLNKYRESGSVACELAANLQMSRAKNFA